MNRITLHRAALAAGAITATVAIACLGVAQEEQRDPPAHIETAQEEQRADAQTNTSKTDSTPSASAASNTAQEEQRATAQTNTSKTDSTPSASEAEPTPAPQEQTAPQEYPSDGFRAVSAGVVHSCGLRESGEITCWGNGLFDFGGLIDAPAGSFRAISASEELTCAIRSSNSAIECWGGNSPHVGVLASWWSPPPEGSFTAVSVGGAYACGLRDTGVIKCWWDRFSVFLTPHDNPEGSFIAVSAGEDHACAIHETGAVECWGSNGQGQADAPAGRFSALSAGGLHTCGLRETGAVECWGSNSQGQADAPAGRFSALSASLWHTCGLRETGAVECWGRNNYGQTDAPAGRFSALSAGRSHTCGLRETGAVECWGWDRYGQSSAPLSGSTGIPPVGGEGGQMTIDEYAVWCDGFEILGDPNEVATSWHEVERTLATVLEQLEHVAARAPAELESYHGTAMEMIEEMLDFARRQDGEYDQDAVNAALLPLLFVYAGRIDDTKADLTPSTRAKLEAAGC